MAVMKLITYDFFVGGDGRFGAPAESMSKIIPSTCYDICITWLILKVKIKKKKELHKEELISAALSY